ncbi:hypothetical protein MCOR02_008992 [Pyricularia oryzae]|nr:hypothetical protein MCOR02_008992 [Pyricularia oryzae]KAI6258024.1 hypothetical protein MCOR19_005608 [Pyricularia oryzae]KAI6371872.1 hypothetical protein MCOR32_006053 [Pyricularia oryzae]KAI6436344.1 hypothetical protein MCOR24_000461 [Pyricularia oryzae]KAI6488456.1 hypothetical protein MCOR18_002875 [Pyricularia oryzae]
MATNLGATFVPGGGDDYYMPEVIAPAPQRVMPEVPQNMQSDLQRLEQHSADLGANGNQTKGNAASRKTGAHHQRDPSLSTYLNTQVTGGGGTGGSDGGSAAAPSVPQINEPDGIEFRPFEDSDKKTYDKMSSHDAYDAPSFSPFPKVKGENIPLSDEEKEEILYNARSHVLHSNNVSMQLSWARDSLAWVEIMAESWQRENAGAERPRTPKVEHELREDAINIVHYLAEQGHPEALFMRSKWLEFGKFGQRADKKEAYLGYRKAAEQGWGRAEYRMGMLYENSNDMEKAKKHYSLGMEQRDSAASYRLGMMSLLGQHGYPKDFKYGLELIQVAADSADEDAPQGAYVYGMLISKDLPDLDIPENILPTNLGLARQYIEKAAFLGFAKAQSKMGQAYELCQLGCDFNPAYSLHYYGLAARQGQPEASLGVSRWFLFGYEGVFSKNEQLAFKYAKSAADTGLATAEFAMGYYHEIGIHVPKDIREARNWYEKAADHGNKDAEQRLDSLRQSKTLTKEDHETTTLTRIKSQHGSQRGKRPDRFKQRDNGAMPTVAESRSGPGTPIEGTMPVSGRGPSPGHSPVGNGFEGYDQARGRQPAFGVNVGQPPRARSTAPYPEDDRPAPLNMSARARSTAPYPEDERQALYNKLPVSPHYNPDIRGTGVGAPLAERPNSAFGIRADPYQTGGYRQSQAGGPGFAPIPPAGTQGRGRVLSTGPGWDQQAHGGYRQPNTSPAGYGADPYPQGPPQMSGAGGPLSPPMGDPSRNRLTKQPPGPGQPSYSPQGSPGYPPPMANSAVPGRDYGPRTSSRPTSDAYDMRDMRQNMPPAAGRPMSARPDRYDSLPQQQGGGYGGGRTPQQLKDRPSHMNHMDPGRQSAPPGQHGGGRPSPSPSSVPSFSSAQSAPPGRKPVGGGAGDGGAAANKPAPQGPATFEEMGIPQGKNDGDCVVM